ncbi:tumor necrosis factor receptor superfamily member 17 isoform X2 [Heptranchias perlo]|uniref:tumor necrosis factor receptor superfamily member 17 isoform X2 n=1 Tax=Heptranchias perlo TaxID=212740 RepID=UPI0035599B84
MSPTSSFHRMARACSKSFYFDELTMACEPCGLRCNNLKTRPMVCEDYICNNTPVSSMSTWSNETIRNSWIIIGLLPLLTVTLIVFTVVIRKLHQRKASTPFKSTDVTFDSNVIVSSFKENTLAEDISPDIQAFSSARNQQSALFVEFGVSNCTDQGNEMKQLTAGAQENCDCDASLPLPATEEGATVLVTTKTVEWCGYQKM